MKRTTIKHLVALLLMLMAAASAGAQKKAYAVYDLFDDILTFYYDDQISSRQGGKFSLNTGNIMPDWYAEMHTVKKVVFDPSFAEARPTSCYQWFYDDLSYGEGEESQLKTIEGIEYLNTSEVTNMKEMFSNCANLQEVDVSHFNTANVTDMSSMFDGCSSLTSLDVSHFNTANVTDMSYMFYGCSGLKSPSSTRLTQAG